jgi:hypothetical protein
MKHDYTAWRNLDPAIDTKGGATDIIVKAVNDLGETLKKEASANKDILEKSLGDTKTELKKDIIDLDTRVGEAKAGVQKLGDEVTESNSSLQWLRIFAPKIQQANHSRCALNQPLKKTLTTLQSSQKVNPSAL